MPVIDALVAALGAQSRPQFWQGIARQASRILADRT